jgi:cystathionine beta-lyase
MIVFLPGVIVGFNLACHMLAEPGGRVLFQTPVYKPFFGAPGYAGMIRQPVELSQMSNGRYGVDQAQFESAFTPQTQMFLLCNPHNPVGRVFHQDELERMAETCLRREIIICSDEIHADLIYPGHRHIPIASLAPEIARRTITLMAPSKTFNIPGLECAFAIIPDAELRRKYRHAQQGLVPGVNLLGQTAALAAYRDGGEWLSQIRGYLQANRDFLVDFVAAELPEIHLFPPEGTYLAWLDCQALKVSPNPYEFFLQKARVALSDGNTFGRGGEGFLRLNFGCTRPTLAQALERMKTALQEAR